jgi:hypothetical protein
MHYSSVSDTYVRERCISLFLITQHLRYNCTSNVSTYSAAIADNNRSNLTYTKYKEVTCKQNYNTDWRRNINLILYAQ